MLTADEQPKPPQSHSVPTGPETTDALLTESAHFYAAHLVPSPSSQNVPLANRRAPSGTRMESSDRDTMLTEAAHIFATSHFRGYDARYINNPRLEELMNRGRFETSEIRNRAIGLGLLRQEVPHYPEQVHDTAATTEPMFRKLREWLRRIGHSNH